MDGIKETWKQIKGMKFPYFISDSGRVCRKKKDGTFQLSNQCKRGKGLYLCVGLMLSSGRQKTYFVHKLMLETFIGPEKNKVCRHLDGDKYNNNLTNLKWGTHLENSEDRRSHGTLTQGEQVKTSKVTHAEVLEIRRLWRETSLTLAEIGNRFGLSESGVCAITTRRNWKHI